jgi:hypothetical protein
MEVEIDVESVVDTAWVGFNIGGEGLIVDAAKEVVDVVVDSVVLIHKEEIDTTDATAFEITFENIIASVDDPSRLVVLGGIAVVSTVGLSDF